MYINYAVHRIKNLDKIELENRKKERNDGKKTTNDLSLCVCLYSQVFGGSSVRSFLRIRLFVVCSLVIWAKA